MATGCAPHYSERMPIAIVTGSGGLIGSESVRHFVERGLRRDRARERHARALLRAGGVDRRTSPSACPSSTASARSTLDIRDADGVDARVRRARARASSSSSTPPRSRRTTGRRPTRRPTSPSTPTARSTCCEAAREHAPDATFVFCSTNKVYGDRPNFLPLEEHETRLELPRDHRWYGGIDLEMSIDHTHALAVRRLEGRGRPARAGVRPLLRHADRLLPRRLPDRAAARRRAAARLPLLPDALHGHRRAVHDLRLRRQAGARQHPRARRRRAPSTPSTPRRAPPRSTTSAAGARATSRCSRRSRCASRSPAGSSTTRCSTRRASATTAGGSRDLDAFKRDYPEWQLTFGIEDVLREIHDRNVERWQAGARQPRRR